MPATLGWTTGPLQTNHNHTILGVGGGGQETLIYTSAQHVSGALPGSTATAVQLDSYSKCNTTSTAPLHSTPPQHPSTTAPLHSTTLLQHPSTAPLHSTPPQHPSTAPLYSTPPRHPSTAPPLFVSCNFSILLMTSCTHIHV